MAVVSPTEKRAALVVHVWELKLLEERKWKGNEQELGGLGEWLKVFYKKESKLLCWVGKNNTKSQNLNCSQILRSLSLSLLFSILS